MYYNKNRSTFIMPAAPQVVVSEAIEEDDELP
jgi:hypothetical protein